MSGLGLGLGLDEGELLFPRIGEEAFTLEILDRLEEYYGPGDERNEYERKTLIAHPLDGRAAVVFEVFQHFECIFAFLVFV